MYNYTVYPMLNSETREIVIPAGSEVRLFADDNDGMSVVAYGNNTYQVPTNYLATFDAPLNAEVN